MTATGHRRSLRRLGITVAVAAAVVAADQAATSWAVHRLARGPIHVLGPLDLQLQVNTGSAFFSLAQGWEAVFGALAAVVVVVLVAASRRARSDGLAAAIGLVVGGALGNLADRIFRHYHGGVVDFIALHFWPTFNVADACITVGVVLVAVGLWRSPSPSDPSEPPAPPGTGAAPERDAESPVIDAGTGPGAAGTDPSPDGAPGPPAAGSSSGGANRPLVDGAR